MVCGLPKPPDGFNVPGGYRIKLWNDLAAGQYSVDFVGSLSNGPGSLGDRNHEGRSGWRIEQIDDNVTNWLGTYQPEIVLLLIGTNDMLQSYQSALRISTTTSTPTTRPYDPGTGHHRRQHRSRRGGDL